MDWVLLASGLGLGLAVPGFKGSFWVGLVSAGASVLGGLVRGSHWARGRAWQPAGVAVKLAAKLAAKLAVKLAAKLAVKFVPARRHRDVGRELGRVGGAWRHGPRAPPHPPTVTNNSN